MFTIFILDLRGSQEDSICHLNFAARPIMRSINLSVLAELRQDLTGLQRVSPNVVSMADGKGRPEKANKLKTIMFFCFCF